MPQGGLPTAGLEWKSGGQAHWKTCAPITHNFRDTGPRAQTTLETPSPIYTEPESLLVLGIGKQWGTKWGAGRWEPQGTGRTPRTLDFPAPKAPRPSASRSHWPFRAGAS
jgi:hypothetical protein